MRCRNTSVLRLLHSRSALRGSQTSSSNKTTICLSRRHMGPFRNYQYGGKDFYHKELQSLGVNTKQGRVRGRVAYWNPRDSSGIILCDLTGEHYHFTHDEILGKSGFRELPVWRSVEFSPRRHGAHELYALDVIDLGPSDYAPPTGITEKEAYPTMHLEDSEGQSKKNQWDSIPYWYHPVKKSHGPLCEIPALKPLVYKDRKWRGKL